MGRISFDWSVSKCYVPSVMIVMVGLVSIWRRSNLELSWQTSQAFSLLMPAYTTNIMDGSSLGNKARTIDT